MNLPIQTRNVAVIAAALACVALSENLRAVSPPPDGGYANANTAEGDDALFSLTTGERNTAVGTDALYSNASGNDNTAVGELTLPGNTTGVQNTAIGSQALSRNTDNGNGNTATGFSALNANTSGGANTATGAASLQGNASGNQNVANGSTALTSNSTGSGNTAVGSQAMFQNSTGSENIALGFQAGVNLTTGSNNIDIGNAGVAGESNTIRIGTHGMQTATYVAGISGVIVGKGEPVVINSNGQLGTKKSSAQFKDQIKPMDKTSEAIFALKPVTFLYKKQFDSDRTPQFGLIAEDVAKADPDLVLRDQNGNVSSVRYDEVNAMLLNEFLKEHQKVRQLETALAAVHKQLQEEDAKIDKLNANAMLAKPVEKTAKNP